MNKKYNRPEFEIKSLRIKENILATDLSVTPEYDDEWDKDTSGEENA